jgi:MFS family permease
MKIFSSPHFSIFRNTNFTFYLFARLLGTMGVQIQSVAVGWQVYQLTGSLFDLGLIGLAQFLPFLCFILIAGHAADRYSRRLIMILCMGVQVVCALFLLVFTLMGIKSVWPIFVVLALFGCARAFMMPASQAILINLVPTELFGRAVAVSSSTFHLAIILGPVFGGLLYLMGPAVVYVVVILVALGALMLMMQTKLIAQIKQTTPATLHSLLEGLRFVFSRPVMLGALSLDLFAVL